MVTEATFRRLALAMAGAAEGAHNGHPDFRANGRVFASLHPGGERGMVKVGPEEQRELVRRHPHAFSPSSGAWGRQGCTDVALGGADEDVLRGALHLAWQAVAARPPARRRR
jgi:hypothetical protein